MAKTQAAEAPLARMRVSDGDRAPIIRRPKPQDALDLAQAMFMSGVRVEVGTLAAQLGISQPTLYRWFGTREELLDRVLEQVTSELVAVAQGECEGEGDERVLAFVRLLMSAGAALQPGVTFIGREPQLALRLVLGETGGVHRGLARALRTVVDETRSADEAAGVEKHVDLVVRICTGLLWTAVAIGDEPDLEGALEIVRALLLTGCSS
jgi:AcrR family transcriptional regulator